MCDDKMGLEETLGGLEQGQSLRRHNPRPSSRCSGWQKGLSARRGESGAAEGRRAEAEAELLVGSPVWGDSIFAAMDLAGWAGWLNRAAAGCRC